ncbi:helix-turn-helix domain-containing protein [Nocardia sp. NPDC004068]|uniref:helix-turn-helix domain-containing protein n=1 Tax=Nocardia sp. NPDC004068 TaxID=3364303 RepID=UPI0036ACB419
MNRRVEQLKLPISTIARRALGRELMIHREKTTFTRNAAARLLGVSPQTMARVEEGVNAKPMSDLYVNTLCDAYGISDKSRRQLLALAKEHRTYVRNGGGWWRSRVDSAPGDIDIRSTIGDLSQRLCAWHVILLPEVVQTADYRQAVAWTACPNAPATQVAARMERSTHRQRRIEDETFSAEILLSEAAIREQWGGPGVMNEQRRFLLEIGKRPNVSIRVVPFDARSHIGALVNSFSLLEFPVQPKTRLTQPPVIYIEEYAGELFLERTEEVQAYMAVLAELRRVALSDADTAELIAATVSG